MSRTRSFLLLSFSDVQPMMLIVESSNSLQGSLPALGKGNTSLARGLLALCCNGAVLELGECDVEIDCAASHWRTHMQCFSRTYSCRVW